MTSLSAVSYCAKPATCVTGERVGDIDDDAVLDRDGLVLGRGM